MQFWLREETKSNEFRRALTPDSCEQLIAAGHTVVVEDWKDSIIPTEDYKAVGCEIVAAGSWIDSDLQNIIVGLKALPENIESFKHTHIFFAHVYKEQDGWREIMQKFQKGGGRIIDLEFMLDENNKRVCAFGYWAGFVGAGLGALFSKTDDHNKAKQALNKSKRFKDKEEFLDFIKRHSKVSVAEAIVIGANGRSGSGALDCLKELGWNVTGWDKIDTSRGGPFPEILSFDLFVNCVLAMSKMPPFITKDLLKEPRKLNMISDVSCDPDSDCNMIPIYTEATKIDDPVIDIEGLGEQLGLIAIDNLPSILPKESSFDFSSQLVSHLLDFSDDVTPIKKSLEFFTQTMSEI